MHPSVVDMVSGISKACPSITSYSLAVKESGTWRPAFWETVDHSLEHGHREIKPMTLLERFQILMPLPPSGGPGAE